MEIEDIKIGGNTYQETREGYNLFNADREFPFTQAGVTFSKNEDGSITLNGTCTANVNANVSMGYNQEQQEVMSGKEYAFQIKTVGTGKIPGFGLKHYGNSDRFTVPLTNAGIFQKTAVYTKRDTDTGLLYWTCWIEKDTVFTDYTIYPCFVKGTEYKDYEKNGKKPTVEEHSEIQKVTGDVEVSVRNKNLLDIANNNIVAPPGIVMTKISNNRFHLEGIATGAYRINNLTNKIYLSAGTYTYSKNIFGTCPTSTFSLTIRNLKTGVTSKFGLGLNETNRSFTISDDSEIIYFTIESFTVGERYNFDVELQLELRSEATEYVSYEGTDYELNLSDMELCKIADCQDYIYKDKNKWHLHKELNRVAFDGIENWSIQVKETGYEDNPQTFVLKNIADMKDTNFNVVQKNVCCNWSLCGQYAARFLTRGIYKGIECGGRAIYVCLEKFNDFTLDEFKAYLAEQYANGTPLEIVYELETPVDEEITDESLIAQLEALNKVKTYKKITHIDSVTNDLRPIIKIKYKKDLETVFNNFETRLNLLESEG